MKETYWNQFMASGRIDDYLKFKMHEKNSSVMPEQSCRKEQRESDCSDRDGAVNNTGGRI